jgi:hypothetical protein
MKFRCVATNSAGSATSSSATLTVNALVPSASVAVGDAVCSETSANPGTFIITLSTPSPAAVTVTYALTGRAHNGTDYGTVPTSVSIPAGQTTATVTVTPIDDSKYEKAESVILTLTAGSGYSVGSPSTATLSLQDNDGLQQTSTALSFSQAPIAGTAITYTAPSNAEWLTDLNTTWAWGDGSSTPVSGSTSSTHTYGAAGPYTITVTLVDPVNSATLVETFPITVSSGSGAGGGGGGAGGSKGGGGSCAMGSGLGMMLLVLIGACRLGRPSRRD